MSTPVSLGYGPSPLVVSLGYGQSIITGVYALLLTETILLTDTLSTAYQQFIRELAARIYINLLRQKTTLDLLNSNLQSDLHISGTPLNMLKTKMKTTTLQQKGILKALRDNLKMELEI